MGLQYVTVYEPTDRLNDGYTVVFQFAGYGTCVTFSKGMSVSGVAHSLREAARLIDVHSLLPPEASDPAVVDLSKRVMELSRYNADLQEFLAGARGAKAMLESKLNRYTARLAELEDCNIELRDRLEQLESVLDKVQMSAWNWDRLEMDGMEIYDPDGFSGAVTTETPICRAEFRRRRAACTLMPIDREED